jgi:hypothetical protein
MRGAIPPLFQYAFMAWCLVKYRDNFTFTFILPYYYSIYNKQSMGIVFNLHHDDFEKKFIIFITST